MKRCFDIEEENFVRKKACEESAAKMIRPSDVPAYLHDSAFFRSLNLDDDEEFYIPPTLMKSSTDVESLEDLEDLLNTIRYWGLDVCPNSIVAFALTQEFSAIKPILDAVENEILLAKVLLVVLNDSTAASTRMEAAMELGNIEVVRHVEQHSENVRELYSSQAIASAAENGNVTCLKHALENRNRWADKLTYTTYYPRGSDIYEGAVAKGHLACVKLLCQSGLSTYSGPKWTVTQVAAMNGQFECLKYLHLMGHRMDACATAAATSGNLACLQYVVAKKEMYFGNWGVHVCEAAAKAGHLLCLKYLHDAGCPWTDNVCVVAALANNSVCLQYAHRNGCTMTSNVCTEAAAVGALDCLKYYCEYGGEWHFLVCHTAALHGHLACLEYAHTRGCPLIVTVSVKTYRQRFKVNNGPAQLVEEVAKRKHWGCVLYLILHNYPLTSKLSAQLARKHKDSLLRLAVEHGCPLATEVGVQYARSGDLTGLIFALERGCKPSAQILTAAASKGQMECLTYAHEHDCLWSEKVCVAAARGGHLQCLQFAHEHGCPWDVMVRWAATLMHHKDIVEYAEKHKCPVE